MRQSLIWLLMMVVTVLGACGDQAVEVEELPLDSAVFETGLTESEDLLETDNVIDLALASPFYQSDGLRVQFNDQHFFEVWDETVEALLAQSKETYTHARALVAQIDQYQSESLQLIELWKETDEALEPLYYDWLYRYSNQNAELTLLQAEIDVLEDQTSSPYNQAWVDYLLVGKRLLFNNQVINLYNETTIDVLMVKEEMVMRSLPENTEHHAFNFDQSYNSGTQFDDSYEYVVTSTDFLARLLQKLTESDDRLSRFLAESAIDLSTDLAASISKVETDQLTDQEKKFLLETTTIYEDWFTEKRDDLLKHPELQLSYFDDKGTETTWTWVQPVLAGGVTVDYHEIVADMEAGVERVVSEEELGFFGKMKQKVLNVPGRLIERYNTVTYNYFFESYAEKLGVDQAVIKEVTDEVKQEEARRVRDGQAGVAPVNQALTWMEETEDQIIEAITSPTEGEDDLIVKTTNYVTKGFLKYGFSLATSGSKAMVGVLDQQASDAKTFKHLLIIANSVFDFSKKTEQAINVTTSMLEDDVLELLEQEKSRIAVQSKDMSEQLKTIKDESYRRTDQVKDDLFVFSKTFDDVTYKETSYMLEEVIKGDKQRLENLYPTAVAVDDDQQDGTENQGVVDEDDQGVELEDNEGSENQIDPVDQQPTLPIDPEEDQGTEDQIDDEVELEDNTSSDPLINDNTLALKAGTYRGVFTGADTDYGSLSADQMTNDRFTLTVTGKQITITSDGVSNLFVPNSGYSMAFTVRQTDMAGRLLGDGYLPAHYITRDYGPPGPHYVAISLHVGPDSGSGYIHLHYVDQRIGRMDFTVARAD